MTAFRSRRWHPGWLPLLTLVPSLFVLSTLPVNPTLQSQGYVREIDAITVGASRFYLYRKVAAATPRWTLARADGSELTDGQSEPLAFDVTILDLPTELPLTVRNLGNTPLSGFAARFDGDQAAEFSGKLAQASLPPGATTILAMRGGKAIGSDLSI